MVPWIKLVQFPAFFVVRFVGKTMRVDGHKWGVRGLHIP
jgi:hypothetical protein